MASRKESAADITVSVGSSEPDLPVEALSLTKNIDIETIYGSGRIYPDGYAINQVSYEGSMNIKGHKIDLDDVFFENSGIPKVVDAITVTHLDGRETAFNDILVTSDGYEVNSGETTETAYEFIAMSKTSDGDTDQEPTN